MIVAHDIRHGLKANHQIRADGLRRRHTTKGGTPRIVATGMSGRDEAETQARLEAFNQPIQRIRGRIEKIFGTWKRSYGLRWMRWRGLAKAGVQIRLTAIAYNMKRSLKIIAMAG
ncbi:transposase [Rhizobium sp. PP-CC-3G-465]|uniref:transposase n=1 Tax=Rhizobium sp. PP-CC-3G-465 TaxID=2135648 RepID=UPI003BAC4D1A